MKEVDITTKRSLKILRLMNKNTPHKKLRILRYNHCGAILSTASKLGTKPTTKNAIINMEGIKLVVSSEFCLEADLTILIFFFITLQDKDLFVTLTFQTIWEF